MSASDQSAQTNKTDGTDGTVKARVSPYLSLSLIENESPLIYLGVRCAAQGRASRSDP
jgi:hypothetical protein